MTTQKTARNDATTPVTLDQVSRMSQREVVGIAKSIAIIEDSEMSQVTCKRCNLKRPEAVSVTVGMSTVGTCFYCLTEEEAKFLGVEKPKAVDTSLIHNVRTSFVSVLRDLRDKEYDAAIELLKEVIADVELEAMPAEEEVA